MVWRHKVDTTVPENGIIQVPEISKQWDKFVILKNDKAVAKIIPFQRKKHKRILGTAKGLVIIKDNFKEIPDGFEEYIPFYC